MCLGILIRQPLEEYELLRNRPTFKKSEDNVWEKVKQETNDVNMDVTPGETSDDYVIDRKTVCTMTASEVEVNNLINDYITKEDPGSSEDETLLPADFSKTKFYSSQLVVRRK